MSSLDEAGSIVKSLDLLLLSMFFRFFAVYIFAAYIFAAYRVRVSSSNVYRILFDVDRQTLISN